MGCPVVGPHAVPTSPQPDSTDASNPSVKDCLRMLAKSVIEVVIEVVITNVSHLQGFSRHSPFSSCSPQRLTKVRFSVLLGSMKVHGALGLPFMLQ